MNAKKLTPSGRSANPSDSNDNSPFALMRREMDRLFDSFSHDWGGWNWTSSPSLPSGFLTPKVDVAETEKGLEINAELPGIDQKDIELDLTDGVLTLKAEHREEKENKDEKKHYHVVERSRGSLMRRFALPFEPETDKVQASFDKGVLKVIVPRSAAAAKSVKKIAIKGS